MSVLRGLNRTMSFKRDKESSPEDETDEFRSTRFLSDAAEIDKDQIAKEDSSVDLVRPYLVLEPILFPWTSTSGESSNQVVEKGPKAWFAKLTRRRRRSKIKVQGNNAATSITTADSVSVSDSIPHDETSPVAESLTGIPSSTKDDLAHSSAESTESNIGGDWNTELRHLQEKCILILMKSSERDIQAQNAAAREAIKLVVKSHLYAPFNVNDELQLQLLRQLDDNSCPCVWITPIKKGKSCEEATRKNLVHVIESLDFFRDQDTLSTSQHERFVRAVLRATCLRLEAPWTPGDTTHSAHIPLRLIRRSARAQAATQQADSLPSDADQSTRNEPQPAVLKVTSLATSNEPVVPSEPPAKSSRKKRASKGAALRIGRRSIKSTSRSSPIDSGLTAAEAVSNDFGYCSDNSFEPDEEPIPLRDWAIKDSFSRSRSRKKQSSKGTALRIGRRANKSTSTPKTTEKRVENITPDRPNRDDAEDVTQNSKSTTLRKGRRANKSTSTPKTTEKRVENIAPDRPKENGDDAEDVTQNCESTPHPGSGTAEEQEVSSSGNEKAERTKSVGRRTHQRQASTGMSLAGNARHSFSRVRSFLSPSNLRNQAEELLASANASGNQLSLLESLTFSKLGRMDKPHGPVASLRLMDSLLLEGHILHNLYAGVVLDLLYEDEKGATEDTNEPRRTSVRVPETS